MSILDPIPPPQPGCLTDLKQVVLLLYQASRLALETTVESAAARSLWSSFALGVILAHSRAVALLPDDVVLVDGDIGDRVTGDLTPQGLLIAAEEITRRLPLGTPATAGLPLLVTELIDLIREAAALDG